MDRRRFKEPVPERYQVLEYLESTGTQYIDTGIGANNRTFEFDAKYSITAAINGNMLFGAGGARADIGSFYWQPNNAANTQLNGHFDTVDYTGVGKQAVQGTIYTAKMRSDRKLYLNDELLTTFGGFRIRTNITMFLFASHYLTGPTQIINGRIYYAKFWFDDNLQIDYVPVRRLSDGELGMYDKVTGKFYTNAGTGEFIGGNPTGDIIPDCDLPGELGPDNPLKAKFIGYKKVDYTPDVILPNEYQQVPYIESDGQAYMLSKINDLVNQANYIEIHFRFADTKLVSINNIWGRNNPYAYIDNYSRGRVTYNDAQIINFREAPLTNNIEIAILDTRNKTLYFNGFTKSGGNVPSGGGRMSLFCRWQNNSPMYIGGRIFYYVAKKDGVLVEELIPCYRKTDNKPGMYDTVSGEFRINEGDGEFIIPNLQLVDRLWDYKRGLYNPTTGEFTKL